MEIGFLRVHSSARTSARIATISSPHLRARRDDFRAQLGNALLQLRVKSREVQLVHLAQLGPVRGIHAVDEIDELVGEFVAKVFVEATGEFCRERHWLPEGSDQRHHNDTLGAGTHQ